ncbi:MAG: hypothetical protein R8L07_03595 [Alphaproteobacteria bacterium]|nr:hypothetical protein [Alphaproteobacteria bacterium]
MPSRQEKLSSRLRALLEEATPLPIEARRSILKNSVRCVGIDALVAYRIEAMYGTDLEHLTANQIDDTLSYVNTVARMMRGALSRREAANG